MDSEKRAELRAIAEAATPGPWMWHGNCGRPHGGKHIRLSTIGRGGATVMGFDRMGMQGAQPIFFDRTKEDLQGHWVGGGRFKKAMDVAVPEVDYRGDIHHLENADATYIARVSPDVLVKLLDYIEFLEALASP